MRIIIWLLIGYCAWLFLKSRGRKEIPPGLRHREKRNYQDPVCGVYVAGDDAVIGNLEGEKIYFCSMACLEKYREQISHKRERASAAKHNTSHQNDNTCSN